MKESILIENSPIVLQMRPVFEMTDEQFFEFCQLNRDYRIERTANGEIMIMSPTGSETGNRNAKLTQQLGNWTDKDGTGIDFDSSSAFRLPNGADRLKPLQDKLQEYIENGASLGWLIDRKNRNVYVYRSQAEVECLENPVKVSGEPVLSGFVLNMEKIW